LLRSYFIRTKLDSLDFLFKEVLDAEQATYMITKLRHHINNLYDHYNNIGGSSCHVQHGGELPKCSSIIIDESKSGNLSHHFMNKFHSAEILKVMYKTNKR